jgi:UDP-N-acetyl-2-amino-2-deoxyglucuronate dehydrogenase
MKTVLNFALVGCGRVAQKYFQHLISDPIDGARLVAICDIDEQRAIKSGRKFDLPWFPNIADMLSTMGEKVDVVLVLTPSGLHAEQVIEIAEFQKHVVVEKPMALTLESADRMIHACDQFGVRLFVVKQNRWNKPVQLLHTALRQGAFGKLVMGTVRVRWCRGQAYYDQDAWRGTWKLDGGVFSNQASHHIDLLEWMLGEPETVYATARTALVDIETEDTGVAVVRFRCGALGVIEATTAARPKDLEGSLSILGERGIVEIGGFAVNELKTWEFEDNVPLQPISDSSENPPDVYGFGHRAYIRHVVDSLENGTPALVDGLEGRKSLELISAIYESIETGQEVALRFRSKHSRLGADD